MNPGRPAERRRHWRTVCLLVTGDPHGGRRPLLFLTDDIDPESWAALR
jgi:hypothetical protein